MRRWGEPRKFEFQPLDHVALGEGLGGMDFEAATRISGARFVVLRSHVAHLHRALAQFMLDLHTVEHGYTEIHAPYMVNAAALVGTGNLPKFEQDLFAVRGEQPFYLIPTAEVPVTNLVRDQIVAADSLPLKFVCHTPCFRSEAGSAGKDTRGMIRNHQFDKVELVQIVTPENSYAALEELTGHAQTVLEKLEIPYRPWRCAPGISALAAPRPMTWKCGCPGRTVTARSPRAAISRPSRPGACSALAQSGHGQTEPVHTLNGSGVAVGRALVAILENYRNADGSITVPAVLRPYLRGLGRITKDKRS